MPHIKQSVTSTSGGRNRSPVAAVCHRRTGGNGFGGHRPPLECWPTSYSALIEGGEYEKPSGTNPSLHSGAASRHDGADPRGHHGRRSGHAFVSAHERSRQASSAARRKISAGRYSDQQLP